jgi:hypothetical protein
MWKPRDRSNPRGRHSAARSSRKNRLLVEALEGRTLLTIGFATALDIQGSGVVVSGVAIDAQGNAYVAGYYTGSATFGKDSGGKIIHKDNPSMVNSESFVVAYSPTGVVQWLTEFATEPGDPYSMSTASSLAYDAASSTLYVAGNFTGQVDFDPFGAGDVRESSIHFMDLGFATDTYIIGLNASNGRERNNLFDDFVVNYNSPAVATAWHVTTDPAGTAIYVTGFYSSSADAVGINGTNPTLLTTPPGSDLEGFTVKFNNNLVPVWAVNTSNAVGGILDNSQNLGVAASDKLGADYVVGSDLGGKTAFVEVLDDSDGSQISTDQMATTGFAQANAVVTDSAGNAYVVGSFKGHLTPGDLAAPLVSNSAGQDAFMVALDSSLDELFGVRFGSAIDDSGDAVGIDGSGNLYMSGYDGGPSSFGTATAAVLREGDGTNTDEAYVIEVSSKGNFLASAQSTVKGAGAASAADEIAVNSAGLAVAAGGLTGEGTFGTVTIGNGNDSSFIGLLSPTDVNFTGLLSPTSTSGGGGGGGNGGSGGGSSGGSTRGGGGNGGGSVTSSTPALVHFTTVLVTRKVGKTKLHYIQVTSSAGGTPELIQSPFQPSKYKAITVVPADTDGDGSDDSVIVSARKGKRTVTVTLPA